MRITIQTPDDGGSRLQSDGALQRAFGALHRAGIQTRGGGRFADSSTAVILARETDALKALVVLKLAGIRALPS
jgi:hypothetical protein